MSEAKSLTTPYYVAYRNMIHGNHTILLLEYNQDGGFFLDPGDALAALVKTEEVPGKKRHDVVYILHSRIKDRVRRPVDCRRHGIEPSRDGLWHAPPCNNHSWKHALYGVRRPEEIVMKVHRRAPGQHGQAQEHSDPDA